MANQEHLALLKQGVAVWSQWREEHSSEKIDLSGAHLKGALLAKGTHGNNMTAFVSTRYTSANFAGHLISVSLLRLSLHTLTFARSRGLLR